MKQYDVIIIGGGLGGLTAGAKLAKNGKKILLIEQHNVPGGCATSFKRKDYVMEVGLHALDGLDEKDPKKQIFEELGIFDHVDFIAAPEFYRIKNKKIDINLPSSKKDAIKILSEKFPKEKKGIKKFFKTIHSIQNETGKIPVERWKIIALIPFFPIIYPYITFNTFRTVGHFIDSIMKNEDLKITLLANLFYYHDDPYSMSLIYFSAAQASYFNGGAHFIKGGSQKLSNYLASVIKHNKGEILLNTLVTKIITKKNKAIGVTYTNTLHQNNNAFSKKIIANAAIPNVVYMLSGKSRLLLEKKTNRLITPCSLISIYIGFKREVKEIGNKHYSTFLTNDNIKKISEIVKNFRGNISQRNFVFVDYSQIDSNLAPKGKSFGTICAPDYLSDWKHLSNEEYKKKKNEVAHSFFERLEKLIPGIRDEIECYEVATPKTIQKYTLNPEGSAYGFAQIPSQAGIFRLPNKSPIKNLYFASAWTNPGGGFSGAILSGWYCANEVTKALGRS